MGHGDETGKGRRQCPIVCNKQTAEALYTRIHKERQGPDIQGYILIYDDDKLYDVTHWNTSTSTCVMIYVYNYTGWHKVRGATNGVHR